MAWRSASFAGSPMGIAVAISSWLPSRWHLRRECEHRVRPTLHRPADAALPSPACRCGCALCHPATEPRVTEHDRLRYEEYLNQLPRAKSAALRTCSTTPQTDIRCRHGPLP